MIECGWCGAPASGERCSHCGRNPAVPWEQRATEPPPAQLDNHRRLADAERSLREAGRPVTVLNIADLLDVSERTVRRWQQMTD
jgi:hypothetical protein